MTQPPKTQLEHAFQTIERLERENAGLLEALGKAKLEITDPNRGPSGSKPTLTTIDAAIARARP